MTNVHAQRDRSTVDLDRTVDGRRCRVTAVSVDELQRAWAAVEAGKFRTGAHTNRPRSHGPTWQPAEPVVLVAGASGRVGASAVALAIATATDRPARVVECAPVHATGFAAATTAELGVNDDGWRHGSRDLVRIERTTTSVQQPDEVPIPGPTDCDVTVVDLGWDLVQVQAIDSWLNDLTHSAPVVLVAVATAPGLRALETAASRIQRPDQTWAVVVGPPRRRCPRALRRAFGAAVETLDDSGRLHTVPENHDLAMHGLTPDPLPHSVVTACRGMAEETVHPEGRWLPC